MKYKLLHELPGHKAGEVIDTTAQTVKWYDLSYEITMDLHNPDWFQPLSQNIMATNGQEVQVSPEDYEELSSYNWGINKDGYAYRKQYNPEDQSGTSVSMARHIMGVLDEDWHKVQVDHINGDPLDNRRENLRVVTNQHNSFNRGKPNLSNATSQYKGVSWQAHANKWKVLIKKDGKNKHIGYFDTEEDAARAYDMTAKVVHGEYANLNFPDEPIDDTPDWEISTGNWKLENDLIEVWIKNPKQVPVISEAIRAVLAYIQTPWGGYHGLDQADTPQWGSEPEKAIVAARAAVQKGRD